MARKKKKQRSVYRKGRIIKLSKELKKKAKPNNQITKLGLTAVKQLK